MGVSRFVVDYVMNIFPHTNRMAVTRFQHCPRGTLPMHSKGTPHIVERNYLATHDRQPFIHRTLGPRKSHRASGNAPTVG